MSTRPHIDTEKWRALALSIRLWLCEVQVWLAELFGDGPLSRRCKAEVCSDLTRMESGLRSIVVLLALAQMSWTKIPGGSRTSRPASFARRRGKDLRCTGRALRFDARSLKARIARLSAVIDDLDAHVARMMARLAQGLRQLAPIAVDDATTALVAQAVADLTPADSS